METDESEQRAALRLVAASDEQLLEAAAAYESSCMKMNGERGDEWWHRANNLWHACREYARRHSMSDRASGEFRAHDANKLNSLEVEYELEASALLALQHAVDAYRKLRPEADWNTPSGARALARAFVFPGFHPAITGNHRQSPAIRSRRAGTAIIVLRRTWAAAIDRLYAGARRRHE
jgi:hypothetical protein